MTRPRNAGSKQPNRTVRWVAIGALVFAVPFAMGFVLWALFYPEELPWNRSKDARRVEALLQADADALAKGDAQATCRRFWRGPPGSKACDDHIRWFREGLPKFSGSRIRVHEIQTDVHRTRVDAWVEAVGAGGSEHYDFAFIVSCAEDSQVVGPDCPLWVTGAAARKVR